MVSYKVHSAASAVLDINIANPAVVISEVELNGTTAAIIINKDNVKPLIFFMVAVSPVYCIYS